MILLSPALVALWAGCSGETREPSTPVKMLLGVLLVAIAFGMLAFAAADGGDTGRVSALVADLGQCHHRAWRDLAEPDGAVARQPAIAPPRSRGLMMGGWFASLGLGGKLSGSIGGYWDYMPHSRFFLMVVGILMRAAIPLSLLIPQIKRTIRRAERASAA